MHTSMEDKPLIAYHKDAYRNRLMQPSIVMPPPNTSQIVLGDRMYSLTQKC